MNSTARTAQSIEEYQDAFAGRIASLARTHAILTEEIQQFVSFVHLLTQELGPYSDAEEYSIVLDGPAVELPSQIAVPLGMTIHELTTNAVKYGALGKGGGSLKVNWDIVAAKDGRRALSCEWRELDGPIVTPPARQGFGSVLLHRVLSQQIGAAVSVDFPPEGFHLRMVVPIEVEPGVKSFSAKLWHVPARVLPSERILPGASCGPRPRCRKSAAIRTSATSRCEKRSRAAKRSGLTQRRRSSCNWVSSASAAWVAI